MKVEIRNKGNCVSLYNTVAEKEHINVSNSLCNSKWAITELRRRSCVYFNVY